MKAIDTARRLLDTAAALGADDPWTVEDLRRCAVRLDEPLRIALAGSVKAGKSTLLNALVGQDIAPTDATECTRVVTWYRRGATPTVTATYDGDRTTALPVLRPDGRLTFDFGDLTADRVSRLDVTWPARALASTTIVDTPGTVSLSRAVSARASEMLTPSDSDGDVDTLQSGADAVVYLLRTLSATDTAMLGRIGAAIGQSSGPLGVVGVVSRADEIGSGRIDAMTSAARVAGRFADELTRTGLCQAVVPVAGLLALGARTMREVEYRALVELSQVAPDDMSLAMLSADRFAAPTTELPTPAPTRAVLVDRFGMFGVAMAVTLIRLGTPDSPALTAELVQRSGLDDLRRVIDVQFGQRAEQLKTHTALVSLSRILAGLRSSTTESDRLQQEVDRLLADVHGFAELRLLGRLRAGRIALPDDHLDDLTRLIGGQGVDPTRRLGLDPDAGDAQLHDAALVALRTWRTRAAHPLIDRPTASACRVAARSAEGIIADLA